MKRDAGDKLTLANRALSLMQEHGVPAGPESFGVWYRYATGDSKELAREIDHIIRHSLPFSPSVCSYLYHKYVLVNPNQDAFDEATAAAHKVLVKVFEIINDFSGETQGYIKDIDQYLERICYEFTDDMTKAGFKDVVEATIRLKEGSKSIHEKAAQSAREIDGLKQRLEMVTMESR